VRGERSIFVAGAAGAVGRPLCRLLLADGWRVTGTTRSAARAEELRALGVTPAIVDVYDADALCKAVVDAQPEVVVHQLTDLPPGLDPARMAEARERNARIRDVGTRNLVAAAAAAGARRMVAQSIAFALSESLEKFERQVLDGPFTGIVLRYGHFYGPGTGFERRAEKGAVHVDAAADAARRAATRGSAGIYNVAEDGGPGSSERAAAELGWRADFRTG
jgi:nucleoside-diphosphate-sugar epimerase